MTIRSYKLMVQTGTDPKWYGNAIRLATRAEADRYGLQKAIDWTAVADYRIDESEDPVNYRYTDNGLEPVDE